MSIILRENEWAKKMIDSHTIGGKPFETLKRVARYYLDSGMKKSKVRAQLDLFILSCDPTASLPKWSSLADAALKKAYKSPAVDIPFIEISKPEMDKIDSLNGVQIRRLAFTLLCLAKYYDSINPAMNHWVTCGDSEIMKMANINTSIKRQSAMYSTMGELGMLRFSRKVDNTNMQVLFIEDGDPAIRIDDFRNLGYQYLMLHGGDYFKCDNCGVVTKYKCKDKGRKQKYCTNCAVEIKTKQSVNSVMRHKKITNFEEV